MPKTKDAFALRDGGFKLFVEVLEDLAGTEGCSYIISADSGETSIAGLNNIRNHVFNLLAADEYARAQKQIDFIKDVINYFRNRQKEIKRHLGRLKRYSERLQTHWATTNDLSAVTVRKRTRRVFVLMSEYNSIISVSKNISDDFANFVERIEHEIEGQHTAVFSRRLKEARKEAGLTQAQLAEKIGMKQGSYAQYENMKREPSLKILVRLSKILKRPTDWLLGLE